MTRLHVLACAVILLGVAPPRPADKSIAIMGATLIDGTGSPPLVDSVIVVDGANIVAVGRRGRIAIPPRTTEVDASGKYVIPGLMDASVHLVPGTSIEFIARHEDHYSDLMTEALQVTLRNGVTTVFGTLGPVDSSLDVRDRIRRGEIVGSRFFVGGHIVGLSGPFGRDFNAGGEKTGSRGFVSRVNRAWEANVGRSLVSMTPEQVAGEVRQYLGRGLDFLTYALSARAQVTLLQFSAVAQRGIVEEAHRAGLSVEVHTASLDALRQGIEAGADVIHGAASTGPVPIPDSGIQLALARKVFLAEQPRTLRRMGAERKLAESRTPDELTLLAQRIRHENQVRLVAARVPMLLATEGGLAPPDQLADLSPLERLDRSNVLGEGHFLWLHAMVQKGMSPMEAILSATRNVATAYRLSDRLGTVEVGKLADLVILDANPLADIANV